MKRINKDHIIALFFIATILITSGLMLGKGVLINASFKKEYRELSDQKNLHNKNIFEMIETGTQSFENLIQKCVHKKQYIELYGLYNKISGKKTIQDIMYGRLYKTTDKQIVYTETAKDYYIKQASDNMINFKNELEKLGIPLLYVQVPYKVADETDKLPYSIKSYGDHNIKLFLNNLKQGGVNYIDLTDLVRNKIDEEAFFKTDHHWTIETAFKVTAHLENYLNNNLGFNIADKYSNINNYNCKTYKNAFLGSMGRRTGKIYAGTDDFTLITPNFPTDITLTEIENKNKPTIKRGSFDESVLLKKHLTNPKQVWKNRYACYHGDNRELIFKNHNIDNGKIMMIKDSFGVPVYSLMSLGVSEIRAVDLRLFKESCLEYAKKHKPNVVIILYYETFFSPFMYNFDA